MTISGDVMDYENQLPVSGASVEIYESASGATFVEDFDRLVASGTADAEGHYSTSFNWIEGKLYAIRAVKQNYALNSQPLKISTSSLGDFDLHLASLSWFEFVVQQNEDLKFDSITFNNNFRIYGDTAFYASYARYENEMDFFFWSIHSGNTVRDYFISGDVCQPFDTCTVRLKN